ncbi:MAG: tRNA preQ1(34) S-adenosylmethionine ribosyltransferase-isomerase QueA, partial [Erysipelothrix sp.]|nr:tRNA preQ1(34) S-adenosylmethionine ribosyltransferase-isomerase QueA [Erysipelothrix sp.]
AVKLGSVINIADKLFLHCIEILERGRRVFKLEYTGNLYELLIEIGEIPLPPYIKEQLADDDRYQTVYAKYQGSAAAPTAGLHFTEAILESLKAMGVHVHTITLHVGLGTFLPMQADDVLDHNMHSEHYIMSEATADALNLAKADGRRIIAVGSTSLRTLETNYKMFNGFQAYEGDTNIFIYPGIPVLSTDILITNFHLPESTLMMLISAFGGYDLMMSAYQSAIDHEYRFFSFGDMMWIG